MSPFLTLLSKPICFRSAVLAVLSLITGCGTLPNGRGWGQDATLRPGWDRIRSAAWNAAKSPHVWVPTGTALLLQIDNADQRISDWAVENTPVFGSVDTAIDASDILLGSSFVFLSATALATPSGETSKDWTKSKLTGISVQLTAPLLTLGTTQLLKGTTDRERPNEESRDSFPSGHTSLTAANSMLAIKNTDALQIPGWSKITLRTGFFILPYATGWARIEGEKHYPADVLVGAAIGNFFSVFINEAFMGTDSADDLQLSLDYLPGDSFRLGLSRKF